MSLGGSMAFVYAPRGAQGGRDHLEGRYGIRVSGFRQLEVGVFRVDHDTGPPWVARFLHPGRPIERVEGDAAILAELAAAGIEAERPATDDPVSVFGSFPVLVTTFVDGASPKPTAAGLRAVGDLLGRVHALERRPAFDRPGGSLHHVPGFEGMPGCDLDLAAALLADVDDRIPAKGRPALDRLRAAVEAADRCEDLPHALAHPDPVLGNVVSSRGTGPTLVDWAGTGWGPRVCSLAPLLGAALRPKGWDGERLAAILDGYGRQVELTADEVDRLGAAARIRQLWLAAWNYWVFTNRGSPPTGNEWWQPHDASIDALPVAVARATAANATGWRR